MLRYLNHFNTKSWYEREREMKKLEDMRSERRNNKLKKKTEWLVLNFYCLMFKSKSFS